MNCKNCGFTLPEDSNICPNCGMANIPNNITVENDIPEEEVKPEIVIDSPIPEQVNVENNVEALKEEPKPEVFISNDNTSTNNKKSNKAVIIVIIIVVALLVIGGGIFFTLRFLNSLNPFASKKISTKVTQQQTQTQTQTNKRTVSNDVTSPYKTRKSKSNPKVYIDLSNLTGEEIVNNILDLTEISNGDKAYDYTDRFIYESPNYILTNREHKFGLAGSWSFKDRSKDAYITHVSIYSVQEKDNGTLVIKENPQVQVSLEFKTEEKARETYEAFGKLYEKMGETYIKEKEGGQSVHLKYNDSDYFTSFNYPSKEGRPFEIYTWIPIMYFMEAK